jgi:hypothetical protein
MLYKGSYAQWQEISKLHDWSKRVYADLICDYNPHPAPVDEPIDASLPTDEPTDTPVSTDAPTDTPLSTDEPTDTPVDME